MKNPENEKENDIVNSIRKDILTEMRKRCFYCREGFVFQKTTEPNIIGHQVGKRIASCLSYQLYPLLGIIEQYALIK